MDAILQGLQELDGVLGALAIDGSGQIVAYKAHSVYDGALLQRVARTVAKAVDSIQLLHEDWDGVTVSFADGRLLLRNLAPKGGVQKSTLATLALIADSRLNVSFAGVAVRVAVAKLKALGTSAAQSGPLASAQQSSLGATNPVMAPSPRPGIAASRSDLAASGLAWSDLGGSSLAASGVMVVDASSAAYLTNCTKALAKCVGPMAKAFVKDAVHKICPDRPFSADLGPALVAELERHIENSADLAQFRKVARSVASM